MSRLTDESVLDDDNIKLVKDKKMKTVEEIIKFLETDYKWREQAFDELKSEYYNDELTVEEKNAIYRECLMRYCERELISKILNFIKGDARK